MMNATTEIDFPMTINITYVPITSDSSWNAQGFCSIREFDVIALIIQLIVSTVIIIPNSAVVKVIFTSRSRTYKRPAYSFIASLCIADILVAVYVMISVIVSDIGGFQLTPLLWAVMYICGSIPFYSSVLHLLVIAIDRLLYIGYFNKYKHIMPKKTVASIITMCWILSLLPVLPIALGFGPCGNLCNCPNDGVLTCGDFSCSSIFIVFKKSFLFGNVFFFLFVMIIITVIYSILFWKVRQQSKKAFSHTANANKNNSRMKREYNLARTLAIVILVFFVCWGPLMIAYVIDFSLPFDQRIGEVAANTLSIPNLINSISNPLIYAARMKHMRKEMIPCLKRGFRITSVNSIEFSSPKLWVTRTGRYSLGNEEKSKDFNSNTNDAKSSSNYL